MIGLKYCSSGKNPSGYGSAARAFVTALFVSGVNVTCETIAQMPEITSYGLNGAILNNLERRNIPYKIKIVHLTPDLIPMYKEKGIYTISHLFWECDRLPKEWVAPLNQCDEIWTASHQMSEMIKKSGVSTPCYTFPQPIDVNKGEEIISPFLLPYPKDFTFYSIFQWIDRKNPRGLLRAYWKAFEGRTDVSLLLKTYRMNYSQSEYNIIKQEINRWKMELGLKSYPKIYLVKKLLTSSQINKLHALGDCYVSSSSGEGWNRPVQEAMLFGKPVISGDVGGITDLMTQYYKVDSKSVPATTQPQIPWYEAPQNWKELDEKSLTEQMKFVYSNYKESLKVAKEAQEFVKNQFSLQKVGQQMALRLEKIYEGMQ